MRGAPSVELFKLVSRSSVKLLVTIGENDVVNDTSIGSVQSLKLARAAKIAGEAFAFSEPDAVTPAQPQWAVAAGIVAIAAIAILGFAIAAMV
jgi:hypothetical protein